MKTNVKSRFTEVTHEGAPASRMDAEQELRRSLMSCMLWENEFYEDGVSIATRIAELVPLVSPGKVLEMVNEARNKMNLRHAPLWVIRSMARLEDHKHLVAQALDCAIQRPDEMTEFLSLYWKDGRETLSAQVKKGLAKAFKKFNAYQLAKYNRDDAIKLRDVLFMCHAKPDNKEQEATWKKLVDGTLESPDTWEVSLSAGNDKKETWERLLFENKLGAMALLRNLRNMKEVGVSESLIFSALENAKVDRVLPFRFIAAARYAPQWESRIEPVMLKCIEDRAKLPGKTVLLIDVSGSMDKEISAKSDMQRVDAACGLAVLARELCESVSIFSFSQLVIQIPDRHGFALRDAINTSQSHGGTYLGAAIDAINRQETYDRIIVITDEQSHDAVSNPKTTGYMINVASNKNGVGYGKWRHIDGFSEAVFDYIVEDSQ
ncbi:MAG: TROVE domain-containing protein [Patescibacteria group bacterium]|jgi:hypothetical protein